MTTPPTDRTPPRPDELYISFPFADTRTRWPQPRGRLQGLGPFLWGTHANAVGFRARAHTARVDIEQISTSYQQGFSGGNHTGCGPSPFRVVFRQNLVKMSAKEVSKCRVQGACAGELGEPREAPRGLPGLTCAMNMLKGRYLFAMTVLSVDKCHQASVTMLPRHTCT